MTTLVFGIDMIDIVMRLIYLQLVDDWDPQIFESLLIVDSNAAWATFFHASLQVIAHLTKDIQVPVRVVFRSYVGVLHPEEETVSPVTPFIGEKHKTCWFNHVALVLEVSVDEETIVYIFKYVISCECKVIFRITLKFRTFPHQSKNLFFILWVGNFNLKLFS